MEIMSVFIILINSIEIFFLFRKRNKKQNHETLILSLSFSDLLVGVTKFAWEFIVILYHLNVIFAHLQIRNLNIYLVAPIWFSVYSSLFHIVGITADRYIAIGYPIRHKMWITPFRTRWFLIIIWLLSLVIPSLSIIGAQFDVGNTHRAEVRVKRVLAAFAIFVGCLVAFSYLLIVKAAITSRQTIHGSARGSNHVNFTRKERRLLGLCFSIVLSFFLCMGPISFEILVAGTETVYTCSLMVGNSLLNPLIYFYNKYLDRKKQGTDYSQRNELLVLKPNRLTIKAD